MEALLSKLREWTSDPKLPASPWQREIDNIGQLPWPNPRAVANATDADMPDWARICAVFFCARAIEAAVFARHDLAPAPAIGPTARRPRLPDLDQRIGNLEAAGRLDPLGAAALHMIRKLGNGVRHRGAYPNMADARFCVVMLAIALTRVVATDRALRGWRDASPVDSLDGDVRALETVIADPNVRSVWHLKEAVPTLLEVWEPHAPAGASGNALLLWVIERCLDANRTDLAGELIGPWIPRDASHIPASMEWPDDDYRVAAISRLAALRLSRMGEPARAIGMLTPCAKKAHYLPPHWPAIPSEASLRDDRLRSHACAETLGILAGAHKRLWSKKERAATEAAARHDPDLRVAAMLYGAVHRAQPWNHYIAINRAATAAWTGDKVGAVQAARHALDILKPIRSDPRRTALDNVWADLTWAEALLIAGEKLEACDAYESAFQRHAEGHAGACHSAKQQLAMHVRLGVPSARNALERLALLAGLDIV